jgi:hypothetical protein
LASMAAFTSWAMRSLSDMGAPWSVGLRATKKPA